MKKREIKAILRPLKSSSKCLKRHVACAIIKDGVVLGSGFNKTPQFQADCTTMGECLLEFGHCINTIHAEVSAVVDAWRRGYNQFDLNGATAYISHEPCHRCHTFLQEVGVLTHVVLED